MDDFRHLWEKTPSIKLKDTEIAASVRSLESVLFDIWMSIVTGRMGDWGELGPELWGLVCVCDYPYKVGLNHRSFLTEGGFFCMIRLDSICPQMSLSGTPFQSVLVRWGEGCSNPAAVGFGKFHSRTYMWSGHSRVITKRVSQKIGALARAATIKTNDQC